MPLDRLDRVLAFDVGISLYDVDFASVEGRQAITTRVIISLFLAKEGTNHL